MTSWLRHILTLLVVVSGVSLADTADAAFLPPDFELMSSGPTEETQSTPEARRPELHDAVALAAASMSGTGAPSVSTGGGSVSLCPNNFAANDPSVTTTRLYQMREHVDTSRGFLLDILRPPRI